MKFKKNQKYLLDNKILVIFIGIWEDGYDMCDYCKKFRSKIYEFKQEDSDDVYHFGPNCVKKILLKEVKNEI